MTIPAAAHHHLLSLQACCGRPIRARKLDRNHSAGYSWLPTRPRCAELRLHLQCPRGGESPQRGIRGVGAHAPLTRSAQTRVQSSDLRAQDGRSGLYRRLQRRVCVYCLFCHGRTDYFGWSIRRFGNGRFICSRMVKMTIRGINRFQTLCEHCYVHIPKQQVVSCLPSPQKGVRSWMIRPYNPGRGHNRRP